MKPKTRGKNTMMMIAASNLQVAIDSAIATHYQGLAWAGWSDEDRTEVARLALLSCVASRERDEVT